MGQKSNFLTLKKSFINLNLQTSLKKKFLTGYTFINSFKKLLLRKNILLTNIIFNFTSNILYINTTLFFKTGKLLAYKKKKLKKNIKKSIRFKNLSFHFSVFIFNIFKNFYINTIVFSNKILNNLLKLKNNKQMLKFFYIKCKPFLKLIFQRRFTLFFDFLKKIIFLISNDIDSKCFLQSIAILFKFLHKKNHTKFFNFISLIINLIITLKPTSEPSIKGIKFLIKGRLRGKMRASSKFLQEGKIPTQTINASIGYAKQSVCTAYGVYGLTLWVFKK